MMSKASVLGAVLCAAAILAGGARGDDSRALVARAKANGEKMMAAYSPPDVQAFGEQGGTFWFARKKNPKATDVMRADPANGAISPAIDATRLAAAHSRACGKQVDADALVLQKIQPTATGFFYRSNSGWWHCTIPGYQVTREAPKPAEANLRHPSERPASVDGGAPVSLVFRNSSDQPITLFYIDSAGNKRRYATIPPQDQYEQATFAGHDWLVIGPDENPWGKIRTPGQDTEVHVDGPVAAPLPPTRSPDGNHEVAVENHNVVLRNLKTRTSTRITTDGEAASFYQADSVIWSPDSLRFAIRKLTPAKRRMITLVESSPDDQLQPKTRQVNYPKPGDPIDEARYRIVDAGAGKMLPADDSLSPTPWSLSDGAWSPDSKEFSFLYNQRGHQVLALIGLDRITGKAREIIADRSKTFIDSSQKGWFRRLPESNEILWASERDGYNHLYLIDATTGKVKNQITKGRWNVREVETIDTKKRRLVLGVLGIDPSQDPYHLHWISVDFDGKNLVRLTQADGNHRMTITPDGKFMVATWSRVDHQHVVELHDLATGRLIAMLDRGRVATLKQSGWQTPERFAAPGRDGHTMIHGIIIRPTNFDPARKYPVIENIYAGPHGFFTPKNFLVWSQMHELAELGFIVVQCDGMGTNWRDKAFHDVAWKNLIDGGFPDRIAWIKAAAATRPWMELTRVGIYGGSAGGQNALAGLLTHGEFYTAAVADCGCHDNRMDKIWWNEAWMGWPVDASYAANSNVTHAAKLTRPLLLIVGELDNNVDPSSTLQVVNALEKADKDFDLVIMTGHGHGAAESPYGNRRRAMFFVDHLKP